MIKVNLAKMNKALTLSTIVLFCIFASFCSKSARAAVIHVNTPLDEYGTGIDCSLREAIESINTFSAFGGCPAGDGNNDTVNLPAGTFELTISGKDENSNATGDLDLSADIRILGEGPDITIIKGNPDGTDPSASDRIFDIHSQSELFLGNITIRDGYYENNLQAEGGAIRGNNTDIDVEINDCIIENNATYSYFGNSEGGAVSLSNDSTLAIFSSIFRDNSVESEEMYGGAIYMNLGNVISIHDSVFENNNAHLTLMSIISGSIYASGGAISAYLPNGADIEIYNSKFLDNSITINTINNSVYGYGGAVNLTGSGNTSIEYCSFEQNKIEVAAESYTQLYGGAISLEGGGTTRTSKTTFYQNYINSQNLNENVDAVWGGAIYHGRDQLDVVNSTFSENSVDIDFSSPSGIIGYWPMGGAIFNSDGPVNISFSTFVNNTAGEMYWEDQTLIDYEEKGKFGGTFVTWSNPFYLKSNIITNNLDSTKNCWSVDIPGAFVSEGYNFDNDGTCIGTYNQNYHDQIWFNASETYRNPGELISTPKNASQVESGDFNGDGNQDILIAHSDGTFSEAWISNLDQTFTLIEVPGTNSYLIEQHVVGDFNNDGYDDVAFLNRVFGIYISYFNNAGLNFQVPVQISTANSYTLASGDFDNDGLDDLAYRHDRNTNNAIHISYQNTNGTFTTASVSTSGVHYTSKVGDFNGDGIDDIVIEDTYLLFSNASRSPVLQNVSVSNNGRVIDIAVGSFNGDAFTDWVVAENNDRNRSAKIYYYDGAGNFYRHDLAGSEGYIRDIEVGDLNNDGFDDIVIAKADDLNDQVWISDGSGGFAGIGGFSQIELQSGGYTYDSAVSDLDDDTDLDIVFANHFEQDEQIWINDGYANFTQQILVGSAHDSGKILIGQFDADNHKDILFAITAKPFARQFHPTDQETDGMVEDLAINEGITKSHRLAVNSPALDYSQDCTLVGGTGDNNSDQRGVWRQTPPDGNLDGTESCDSGSFELWVTDLSVSVEDLKDPIDQYDEINYIVKVHNESVNYAKGVVLTNKLPEGTTFKSVSLNSQDNHLILFSSPTYYEADFFTLFDITSFESPEMRILQSVPMVSRGFSGDGTQGMSRNPLTGEIYAVMRWGPGPGLGGNPGMILGIVDPDTGIVDPIGNLLSDKIASITFGNDGTLYGVTGDGADTPETLYTINLATGELTEVNLNGSGGTLGNGIDGEVITFGHDTNYMYHLSGFNYHPDTVFESINLDSGEITNIPFLNTNDGISSITYIEHGKFIGASWRDLHSFQILPTSSGYVVDNRDVNIRLPEESKGLVTANDLNNPCLLESENLVCELGILSPGGTVEVQITATPDDTSVRTARFIDEATVSTASFVQDVNSSNNSAQEETLLVRKAGSGKGYYGPDAEIAVIPGLNFTASEYKINMGQEVTLQWNSRLLDSLKLKSVSGSYYEDVKPEGEITLTLDKTTVFTLEGSGSYGPLKSSIEIKVLGNGTQEAITSSKNSGKKPVIEAFKSAMVKKFEDKTLIEIIWSVKNVESVSISGIGNSLPPKGITQIYITKTTNFTLTATAHNNSGEIRRVIKAAYPGHSSDTLIITSSSIISMLVTTIIILRVNGYNVKPLSKELFSQMKNKYKKISKPKFINEIIKFK